MKTSFNRFAKTAIVAASMFIAFSGSAFAAPAEVSNYLVKQFTHQFRGASNVTWKTTDKFTSASFVQNGQQVSVFYNPESELIGTSKVVTVNELPKKAQKTLQSQYNDYVTVSVIDFEYADGTTKYYVQLENNNQQYILQVTEDGAISDFQK